MPRQIKYWIHRGHSFGALWTPVYEEKPVAKKHGGVYIAFTVLMMTAALTILGYLSGYAVGFNEHLTTEIAKYRVAKKMR